VSEQAPGPVLSKRSKVTIVVDPDAQDRDSIVLAAQDCPVDAIFIVEEESGEQIYP
jgi:ferredoxin